MVNTFLTQYVPRSSTFWFYLLHLTKLLFVSAEIQIDVGYHQQIYHSQELTLYFIKSSTRKRLSSTEELLRRMIDLGPTGRMM